MQIIGYIIVFLATAYSSVSLFGLGWSTEPASFATGVTKFGIICFVAGAVVAQSKKAKMMIVGIAAAPFPVMIFVLMTQGIIQSRAFHQLHWIAIPLEIAAFPVISFIICRKWLV